jgi:hypothetical protein
MLPGPVVNTVNDRERRLDGGLEAAMVGACEREEAEGLLGPGDGAQHFGRSQYRTGIREKHQAHAGTVVDGALDPKQATRERHYGEVNGKAVAIGETKDDGGDVGQANPRAAGLRVGLGEGSHCKISMRVEE